MTSKSLESSYRVNWRRKMTQPIEDLMKEILDKINVMMAYTYVSESSTLMDIYNEIKEQHKKQVEDETAKILASVNLPIEMIDELIEYAFKTKNFKIMTKVDSAGNETQVMRIEKGSSVTDIPMELVNGRSNR